MKYVKDDTHTLRPHSVRTPEAIEKVRELVTSDCRVLSNELNISKEGKLKDLLMETRFEDVEAIKETVAFTLKKIEKEVCKKLFPKPVKPNTEVHYELDILSENLKEFSTNKDSCDTVLQVKDKEFKAHRAILMARCSTFAAMFQHDTLEKQTGIVKIPDCDPESFQEFLDYLYCGKLEDVPYHSAFQLYITSNKYDVQRLKEYCVEYLIQSLTADNVCEIVKLADKYDEEKLLSEAQHFFNKNWNQIFVTTEWGDLMKNDYRLAHKILIEYSKTKESQ